MLHFSLPKLQLADFRRAGVIDCCIAMNAVSVCDVLHYIYTCDESNDCRTLCVRVARRGSSGDASVGSGRAFVQLRMIRKQRGGDSSTPPPPASDTEDKAFSSFVV